jgi:hypothetical protein
MTFEFTIGKHFRCNAALRSSHSLKNEHPSARCPGPGFWQTPGVGSLRRISARLWRAQCAFRDHPITGSDNIRSVIPI